PAPRFQPGDDMKLGRNTVGAALLALGLLGGAGLRGQQPGKPGVEKAPAGGADFVAWVDRLGQGARGGARPRPPGGDGRRAGQRTSAGRSGWRSSTTARSSCSPTTAA